MSNYLKKNQEIKSLLIDQISPGGMIKKVGQTQE